LALDAAASGSACGDLRLFNENNSIEARHIVHWFENAAGLCNRLAALVPGGPVGHFAWRLPWGSMLVLEAREVVAELAAAA